MEANPNAFPRSGGLENAKLRCKGFEEKALAASKSQPNRDFQNLKLDQHNIPTNPQPPSGPAQL